MAYNKAPILAVTMVVILLAAANPVADAQGIVQLFNVTNVVGRLCCAANGSCVGGAPGIPGVLVRLNCSNLLGVTATVGQGTTNASGNFNISTPNMLGSLQGILPNCVATVNLPLNQTVCPILGTTTGILVGVLTFVNSVISIVSGLVANFIVTVFVNVQLPV